MGKVSYGYPARLVGPRQARAGSMNWWQVVTAARSRQPVDARAGSGRSAWPPGAGRFVYEESKVRSGPPTLDTLRF